jgi:hypothetical protein
MKDEIDIPLLDAIKHVSFYVKFFNKLYITKRNEKLKGNEMVSMRENVSAIIQKKLTKRKG